MKKVFSLLMIIGLGCFAVGCGGDPGAQVETEVTEEEETGNMEQMDPTAGLEEEAGGEAPPPAQ